DAGNPARADRPHRGGRPIPGHGRLSAVRMGPVIVVEPDVVVIEPGVRAGCADVVLGVAEGLPQIVEVARRFGYRHERHGTTRAIASRVQVRGELRRWLQPGNLDVRLGRREWLLWG